MYISYGVKQTLKPTQYHSEVIALINMLLLDPGTRINQAQRQRYHGDIKFN